MKKMKKYLKFEYNIHVQITDFLIKYYYLTHFKIN